jgi:hypothetical protein
MLIRLVELTKLATLVWASSLGFPMDMINKINSTVDELTTLQIFRPCIEVTIFLAVVFASMAATLVFSLKLQLRIFQKKVLSSPYSAHP